MSRLVLMYVLIRADSSNRYSKRTDSVLQIAVKRSIKFAPYADLIWLETKMPDLEQARSFARKIREQYPGKCV